MIKVANNIQRMLEKRAYGPEDITRVLPRQGGTLMYSPELGGFHAAGQYPQSMVPEAYQNIQARNYINPARFEEPEYFDNAQEFAMALNTAGISDRWAPEVIDREVANLANSSMMRYRSEDPVAAIMHSRAMKGYLDQAPGASSQLPPFMSTADLANYPRSKGNPHLKIQQQLLRERMDSAKPRTYSTFMTANYDRSPDNPIGITAKNPASDAQVSSIASKLIEDTAKSQGRRLR